MRQKKPHDIAGSVAAVVFWQTAACVPANVLKLEGRESRLSSITHVSSLIGSVRVVLNSGMNNLRLELMTICDHRTGDGTMKVSGQPFYLWLSFTQVSVFWQQTHIDFIDCSVAVYYDMAHKCHYRPINVCVLLRPTNLIQLCPSESRLIL